MTFFNKRLKMLFVLVFSAFLLLQTQCYDIENRIPDRVLDFTRFNLAQRVDPDQNDFTKADISLDRLLKTEAGLAELRAIDKYLKNIIESALSVNSTSADREDLIRYIFEQGELLGSEFSTDLSLGAVWAWPRYYYNQSSQSITVLPEILILSQDTLTTDYRDFGPLVPEFKEIQNLWEEKKIYEASYDNEVMWVPETSAYYQNPNLYELNHIIPLSTLESFYKLLIATLNALDDRNRQMVLAPLRILKRTSETTQRVKAAVQLTSGRFDDNLEELADLFSEESEFDFDIKKYILWAPGNLYYGIKNAETSQTVFKDELHAKLSVIMGSERFREAEKIHNRALHFMDRVGHTSWRVTEKIKSDETLLTELKEIFFKIVYFGLERTSPYLNDRKQWEKKHHGKWELKSVEDYEESLNIHSRSVSETENSALSLFENICYSFNGGNAMERLKFEDSMIRNMMSDKNHTAFVFQEFQKKFPKQHSTSLSGINNFLRKKLRDDHGIMKQECTKYNAYCSRIKKWCNSTNKVIELKSDEKDNPLTLKIKISDLVSSISFPDWCKGTHSNVKNKITTDSAFYRIMTYKSAMKKCFNTTTVENLRYDFMMSSSFGSEENFFEYVEDELQKINSKANKILNEACDEYEKNEKSSKKQTKKPSQEYPTPQTESTIWRLIKAILITLEGSPMQEFQMQQINFHDELRR